MSSIQTLDQISAGGVVYREVAGRYEVALISVGQNERWQLPKGTVDNNEPHEATALREVREEAGVEAELIARLDTVEYWYYATLQGKRVRYHKYVHFFLMRYLSGDVSDHDHEVNEARWMEIQKAIDLLAFKNEQDVVRKAFIKLSSSSSRTDPS
jgi:8-oxo-dGTP diphosphatase